MSKKIVLLFVAMISLSIAAQEDMKEGVLTMKMTMSSDNEQVNASLAMMGDMTMTTYFKNNKSRSEMKNPMAGNNTTIVDNDSKKILALIDNPMLGKKYTKSDINPSEEDLKGLTITLTNDTKTIKGYVCKGYTITGKKDGVDTKMTMYTTEKIKAANQNSVTFGAKIKGFPMYLVTEVSQGGMPMKITMEVTEVKTETVGDDKFAMTIPEGYTKMEMPKPAKID